MILEPKPVPTIIKVDRAFIEKHEPDRYKINRSYFPKKKDTAFNEQLKIFLATPRTSREIEEHFKVNYARAKWALTKIGATRLTQGKRHKPGTWIYEPRRT